MTRTNGHIRQVKASDATAGLDDGTQLATLMRRLYPLVIESAFGDASLAGIPVAFDLSNPYVQTVLDRLAHDVQGVASTTRDEIRALVGRQADEGWTIDELAAEIANLAETRSLTRATTIARTETARAYSLGSKAAWRESGVVDRMQWLTTDPCPICEAFDGMIVGLDQEFADGIAEPPAHPDCRCALSPVLSE